MERSLSPDEACRVIGEELGIERSCVRPCFDENGTGRVCCLVHESWLQRYTAGAPSQDGPVQVSPWSSYEHQLILQPSHPEPDAPWVRISILVIKKPIKKAPLRKSFAGDFGSCVGDTNKFGGLSYAELMQCVGEQNFRHSWDNALVSYPMAAHCVLPAPLQKMSDENMIDEMLWRAYGLSARKLDNAEPIHFGSSAERDAFDDFKEESEGSSLSLIMKQNVVPFVCALEGKSAYFLIEPYFQHSLHNMVTFSPSVLSGSHMRPLFMIYELLHALHWYHCRGLAHGALTLHNVKISKGLWIYLESSDFSYTLHHNSDFISSGVDGMPNGKPKSNPQLDTKELVCKWTRDDLPNLVELWVHGKISNFDYLMALNVLVGRRLGDPNYHPVFPWVTDFSARDGRYRDLKKSKFRLNKGDRQLDVTYKAAWLDSQDGTLPHHVSDVLSDITYHVYLARRTPKSVLCDHVRANWVANEYPSSMERLYHWTPDECIPQFFSDTSIFESIHPDLPDLELPLWTPSAEEFIEWHRSVLESEAVSLNLHHWIDLTFGYKLAGKAAVKAKNVYLHLIDKHQSLSNHGVVQLFAEPHPGRAKPCLPYTLFHGRPDHELVDGKSLRSLLRLETEHLKEKCSLLEESMMSVDSVHESGDFILGDQPTSAENGAETSSKPVPGKEAISEDEGFKGAQFEAISIPTSYNPLDQLERFEALEKFKNQFGPRSDASCGNHENKMDGKTNFGKLVQADMISLGCAIVEMLMPARVQLSTCGLTGKQRQRAIIKLCETNHKLLPRYVRAGVQAFLKGASSSIGGNAASHDVWLPPLTADLLLQPHLGLFPFPSYFSELHEFLAAFYYSGRKQEANAQKSKPPDSLVFLRNEVGYTVEQVDTSASFLPDLLSIVDDEGIKLLLYHLEPLFTCLQTRLHACTQLFDMLAQALGPKNTAKTFLKCLVSLFDSHALENYEVITRQTFLSQIIVRFGLDGFLRHFISFVVDAVAFKSKVDLVADKGDRLSVYSTEDVTPGILAPEMEYTSKDVPLDVDDDLDLPGNFLREASEDQDVKIGSYSMGIEELEAESMPLKRVDRGGGDGEKDDEIAEQVTLMPRGITDEEGDEELFQGNISDDDDEVDGGCSGKMVTFGKIHDGLEIGDEAAVIFGNGDSNSGGTDFEDIELQPVEVSATEGTQKTEEAVTVFEDRGIDDSVTEFEVLQGERVQHDTRERNAVIQELVASNRKAVQISEPDLVKGDGVGLELLKGEMGFGISADNLAAKDERTSEKCAEEYIRDKNPNEVVEDENEEIEEHEDVDEGANIAAKEEVVEEEGSSSEDESQDARILEADDDEATKVEQSANDKGKPVVAAYQIKTFYNGAKSKSMEREKKVQKQHDELTPRAISGIAAESIVWLAPRLGPVLTSKYIASQLLTMLPHCYMGYVGSDDDDHEEKMVNDGKAKWLLFCLANFCTLYGEAFIINQYLPYIEKTIRGVQTKVTQRGEAALAGVLSLLKYCIPYLSRDTLCNYSESELMTDVFQPIIRILSSYTLIFPGGVAARQAICRSYIDVLTVVCLKLERELARENMTATLQQFFSCFELERMRQIKENEMEENSSATEDSTVDIEDALERSDEKDTSGVDEKDSFTEKAEDLYNSPAYNELYQTFSAAIAHHAFVPLCGIMGSKYMESSLHNHDLIWNLCCSHDAQLSHPTCEDTRVSEDEEDGEEIGDNTGGTGTLEVDSGVSAPHGSENGAEERTRDKKDGKEGGKFKKRHKPPMWHIGRRFSKTKDASTNPSPSSSDQYLRGSWLTHWENQLSVKGKIGNKFNLQQVKLQTFTGHSGPVRSVYVQDSEHCFLSASKDKTVKLWSLSNHGDGTAQSASSWTYYRHTRQVFHVGMVESVRHAVSCDGSLHLWDPVSGRCLGIFEHLRNNPIVAMTTLPAPSQCVVAATAEGTARFFDVRQQSFVTEWKVTTSSIAGTVRDICCSPDGRWIALGFSSGFTSVLDIRGGLLRSHRRAHTAEIYQVKAFSNTSFVTSSVDSVILWKDDGQRLRALKGPSDPLPSLLVWRDQVISANMSGRIGVYNLQEDQPEMPYFSYKLSSDVFRGGITCFGYLPLNRLLLIGSDTGNIVLCS